MQLVVEIGAWTLTSVAEAVRALLGRIDGEIEVVVDRSSESSFDLERFDGGPQDALQALEHQEVSAVVIRSGRGHNANVFLYRPFFADSRLPLWHGVIDHLTDRELARIEPLRTIDELVFASVSIEETLDLEEIGSLNDETFPWEHWRLIEAAVAPPGGFSQAKVRCGTAFERLWLQEVHRESSESPDRG